MKTAFASAATLGATIGAVLALSACSPAPTTVRDTGNMAFPAPNAAGQLAPSATGSVRTPTDTGNMAFPAPLPQGQIGTTSTTGANTPTDTGNMAFPAPRPQGRVGTTRTR